MNGIHFNPLSINTTEIEDTREEREPTPIKRYSEYLQSFEGAHVIPFPLSLVPGVKRAGEELSSPAKFPTILDFSEEERNDSGLPSSEI